MDKFDNAITEKAAEFIKSHEPVWREAEGRTDGLPVLTRATMGLARRIIDINVQRPDGIGKEIISDTLKLLCYARPATPVVTPETQEIEDHRRQRRELFMNLEKKCSSFMFLNDAGRDPSKRNTTSKIVIQCEKQDMRPEEFRIMVLVYTFPKAHKKMERLEETEYVGVFSRVNRVCFFFRDFGEDFEKAAAWAKHVSAKTRIPIGDLEPFDSDGFIHEEEGEYSDDEDLNDDEVEEVEGVPAKKNKHFEQIKKCVLEAIDRNGGPGVAKSKATMGAAITLLRRKGLKRGFDREMFLVNIGYAGCEEKNGVIVERDGK